MGKKSKHKQENNGANDIPAVEAEPKRKKKKSAAKKTASRKTSAKRAIKPQKTDRYEPSDDEIRLRAYFSAERRVQLSLGGDPANDWIEARRQLVEEAQQRKSGS